MGQFLSGAAKKKLVQRKADEADNSSTTCMLTNFNKLTFYIIVNILDYIYTHIYVEAI